MCIKGRLIGAHAGVPLGMCVCPSCGVCLRVCGGGEEGVANVDIYVQRSEFNAVAK